MNKPPLNIKILIVEDNEMDTNLLRSALQAVGTVMDVQNIQAAEVALQENVFSFVVTDVNLPDGSGFDLIKKIRADRRTADVPVFVLTGRTAVDDRISGFNLGADDYVIKPFDPGELVARVNRKLQHQATRGSQTSLVNSHFHADFLTQKVSILHSDGGREQLNLTPIESKLLILFLQNEGIIFSRQDLIQRIWGDSVHVTDHTVDTHISTLRKKMAGHAKYVKAVFKRGYCFDSQIK